ncbi:MAG: hypothetical protein LBV55_03040 [Acholeplasmatales bacterium]|jgi:hypothetical protein|nr:hypothetical protein [Acholeplasmatales bacterium]
MHKIDEEYFNEYSFFLKENKELIKIILDKKSFYFDDFYEAFEIMDYIYSYLINHDQFYQNDDLTLFEYTFDYVVNIFAVFKKITEEFILKESNLIYVFELINLYNYNYALHLKIEDEKLQDLINKVEKVLKDYIELLSNGDLNIKVLHSIETLIAHSISDIITEEELPNNVFSLAMKDIESRK